MLFETTFLIYLDYKNLNSAIYIERHCISYACDIFRIGRNKINLIDIENAYIYIVADATARWDSWYRRSPYLTVAAIIGRPHFANELYKTEVWIYARSIRRWRIGRKLHLLIYKYSGGRRGGSQRIRRVCINCSKLRHVNLLSSCINHKTTGSGPADDLATQANY